MGGAATTELRFERHPIHRHAGRRDGARVAGVVSGGGAAFGLERGPWAVRSGAIATFETVGCLGTCPRRLGPLVTAAVVRSVRVGRAFGPAIGPQIGYAFGRRAPTVGAVLSHDVAVGRGAGLRLEGTVTQALAAGRERDSLFPSGFVHHGNRQVSLSVGIGPARRL